MNLLPESLPAAGYVLRESFDYKTELMTFVQQSLRKWNRVTGTYAALNVLLLILMVAQLAWLVASGVAKVGAVLGYMSYGFTFAFLLVPVHEGLHGLAYYRMGAPKVTYEANWRQFHFVAVADRFVADRREFWVVAFTPVVLLTLTLVGVGLCLPPLWRLTLFATALIHAALCSGDFALASYFWENRHRHLVTYDDAPGQRVWFYERPADSAP